MWTNFYCINVLNMTYMKSTFEKNYTSIEKNLPRICLSGHVFYSNILKSNTERQNLYFFKLSQHSGFTCNICYAWRLWAKTSKVEVQLSLVAYLMYHAQDAACIFSILFFTAVYNQERVIMAHVWYARLLL